MSESMLRRQDTGSRRVPRIVGLWPSPLAITAVVVQLQTWFWALVDRTDEDGQSTAEYALVLLGAAAIALLVVSWATRTNWIGRLYNAVMESIVSKVT